MEDQPWSADEMATLERLWLRGDATPLIASALGRSKNSIVGKAHRLRLPGRPSPIKRLPNGTMIVLAEAPAQPKPMVRRPPVPLPPPPPCEPRACCWPIGHPGTAGFRFCGDQVERRDPYCAAHRKIAYTKRPQHEELGADHDRGGHSGGQAGPRP
ncbi:MAG TPA: GcrA family cell cycle regulator [Rhodopila sp.]|nr:GcrA family cell cycle regulator [Rhodopila sp.]